MKLIKDIVEAPGMLVKELSVASSAADLQSDLKTSSATDAGKRDVVDKATASGDISFSLMRNTINTGGEITGSEVAKYIDKAEELNDEVDTVPFGLETNDGKIVKVYVNHEHADAFEEEMKKLLGIEDDIEEAINRLAVKFDIVDVVWPVDDSDGEDDVDDEDLEIDDESDLMLDPEDDEDFADDNFDVVASVGSNDDDPNTRPKAEGLDQEKEMTVGSKFLARVLEEASAEDKDGVQDGFNIPLDSQARALIGKLKLPLAKRLVAFYVMVGIPGRYLNTEDVQGAVLEAADMLRKRVAVRRAFLSLYEGLAAAKNFNLPQAATNEAIELVDEAKADSKQKRGSFIQKLLETVMIELGLPESLVVTSGPAAVGVGIYRTAELIEQDSNLERALRLLATRMGIRQTEATAAVQEDKNEDFKWTLTGLTKDIEKIDEAIDVGEDDFSTAVVGLVAALGIPDDVLQRRRTQIVQALRQKRNSLRNRAQVLTMIGRLQALLERNVDEPTQDS